MRTILSEAMPSKLFRLITSRARNLLGAQGKVFSKLFFGGRASRRAAPDLIHANGAIFLSDGSETPPSFPPCRGAIMGSPDHRLRNSMHTRTKANLGSTGGAHLSTIHMDRLKRLARGTIRNYARSHSSLLRPISAGFASRCELGALLEIIDHTPLAVAGRKAGLAIGLLGQTTT